MCSLLDGSEGPPEPVRLIACENMRMRLADRPRSCVVENVTDLDYRFLSFQIWVDVMAGSMIGAVVLEGTYVCLI